MRPCAPRGRPAQRPFVRWRLGVSAIRGELDEPIGFAGVTLDRHRHVCAFVAGADDEHRVMDPFTREGLERGEKAVHIVDPALTVDYLRRLAAGGIDAITAALRGQFELRT